MPRLRQLLILVLAIATALIPLPAADAAPPASATPRDSRAATPQWTPPFLLPNLVATKARIELYEAADGTRFLRAWVRVLNTGTWVADPSMVRFEIRRDGKLLTFLKLGHLVPLPPGTEKEMHLDLWVERPGGPRTYEMTVVVDPLDKVIESSEADNVVTLTKML